MSAPRRRLQVPTSDLSSPTYNETTAKSTPRRSAVNGQNDTILYIFTVVILVVGLILGYQHMPSPTPPGLNKAIFNSRIYSHIQSLWFAEVPAGATIGGEASVKKWFYNPDAEQKAAFDKVCTQDFRHALEEIGPKRLRLPPFVDFTVERQMARSLASPLMSEIDTSSSDLTTEKAASNALSLILLLDQMSRNIYRSDQALIYNHYDRLSQALIHHILASQPRLDLVPKYRNFPVYRTWFYMPLMHSEHIEDHVLFNSLVTSLKEDVAKQGDTAAVEHLENQLDIEKKHVEIIEQFGRYPYRNKVLGREMTEEEKKWMEEGGDHFGTG
jgi:uncharacterized protein (DUF924 family)